MRAISIRQPFASQIAAGEKTVELRSWYTKHRGPLLVVASAAGPKDVIRGGTVCVVDVVDVVEATRQDFANACCALTKRERPEGFAWRLANARPVPFQAVKGRLGLYEVTLLAPFESLTQCVKESI